MQTYKPSLYNLHNRFTTLTHTHLNVNALIQFTERCLTHPMLGASNWNHMQHSWSRSAKCLSKGEWVIAMLDVQSRMCGCCITRFCVIDLKGRSWQTRTQTAALSHRCRHRCHNSLVTDAFGEVHPFNFHKTKLAMQKCIHEAVYVSFKSCSLKHFKELKCGGENMLVSTQQLALLRGTDGAMLRQKIGIEFA